MNVLSNITQPNASTYSGGDGRRHSMYSDDTARKSAGFTLLQGHIQLMAMVPNLPENLTSPRCKSPADTSSQAHENYESQQIESNLSLPITPRMMPSASKYKRPHLPSILAGKASLEHKPVAPVYQPPRSFSNSSLPPKHSQPITMPSFAKCLPGTKRAIGFGTSMVPGGAAYSKDNHVNNTSSFPIIPSQPSFQNTTTQAVQMINKESHFQNQILEQQTAQLAASPTATFINPYTGGAWLPPQMAYQMVNVVASNQQQQPHFDFLGGSGDHAMASVFQQIQQQQQQQQQQQAFEQATVAYPCYQCPQQQILSTDILQFAQQPPYAVQSLPCFGTTCASSGIPTFGIHGFPVSATAQGRANGHSELVLPPLSSSSTATPQPVYSASMPEICFSTLPSHHHHHHHQSPNHHREHVPPLTRRRSKKGTSSVNTKTGGNNKKEVSIVLDESTSSSTSSSEEEQAEVDDSLTKKHGDSKSSKSISVLKLRKIQKEKEEKKAKEEARYAALGPESDPGKIPSNPRVAHTPIRVRAQHEDSKREGDGGKNEKCGEECCSHCKCRMKKNGDDSKHPQPPQNLEEKVREMKNKLTPRRKGKQVVVAVHDCFPSDSSVSEAESDLDSARKSCFNYTGSNGAMVRKRKPRIDAILKTRMRGDSSEVFDELDTDLSPDEARTYTCDYLVELLTSEDWNNCYTALQVIVRLARYRPKVLLNYLSGPILWCTFHHITSPKSALCRAAIVTFKELFQRIGSALDNDLEKITEKLVLKSLAPNLFIREECDRALEAMVGHCNLVKVLNAMDIVTKRPHARAAGHRLARMALQIVQVAGVDVCLKPVYAEKLLPMLFCFMTEANNGTRTAAKEALGMLMNHLQFEMAVTRHVTFDKNCTEVFKKLDKMRGRNRNRRQVGNARYPLPHAHFRR